MLFVTGSVVRTANVTLIVNGDFTIAASPSSKDGEPEQFHDLHRHDRLTVDGLPSRTTATFTPASVSGSGTSVLTVNVPKNAQKGTRTLTITGTGGGRTHSVNVTVDVR